ncbi:MAG TPA: helix-hairpin-helix domain-containing protein [Chitinophagales bacterium]|nr:helix-hairpin-helix domain-containing protein [Chitinophagales bacterium]
MKWYPFWKAWYFSREQRLGLGLLVVLILTITIIKNPILNYLSKKNEKEIAAQSEQHWTALKAQIDSSKALAKTERDAKQQKKYPKNNVVYKDSKPTFNKIDYSNITIDINQAEANDFAKLKGIGPVLSERILKYRSKLGGFSKAEQVKEVYGISDSLYLSIKKNLKVNPSKIQKLDINNENFENLKSHPYISEKLANQMINYREKIKPFESVEEMKKLYVMTDSIYNKLYPYLTIY